MSRPQVIAPKQEEVDLVAAFVETAEDLAQEPFMAEDEIHRLSSGGGEKETYHLGERTHFRSALISFRRLWMISEPSCYKTVCDVLFKCHEATRPTSLMMRSIIDVYRSGDTWKIVGISNEEIVDLWINTVFAHAGLRQNSKISRKRFDSLVEQFGIGKFEYAFRLSVWHACSQLISLCQQAARPALDDWEKTLSIKPHFNLSSPFGRKMKERLKDGTIIIRKASSKYYNEESLDQRFNRILKRQKFHALAFFFQQLDASSTGKALLALQSDSVKDILKRVDYKYCELPEDENPSWQEFPDMKAASGVGPMHASHTNWQTTIFDTHYQFHASKKAITFLDAYLLELIKTFKSEE